MTTQNNNSVHQKILKIVAKVPFGKVATYGQIASEASIRDARSVGYALSNLKHKNNHKIPWHRIVNRFGEISLQDNDSVRHQAELLEEEGIRFKPDGSINLDEFGWK